jgi:caffeoyl-CoA O-methyltransferase
MTAADIKYVPVDDALLAYLVGSCTPPDPVVARLAEHTAAVGDAAGMAVPVEQSTLLTMLARMVGARTVVDVGTFTGLSALAFARGLVPGGRVISCDVSDRYLELAREHWDLAGVADRIDFRLGSAARTMDTLAPGSVDVVFVDADKMNYPKYLALAVPLLRSGGLLLADNVLLDGHVVDPARAPKGLARRSVERLREFNAALAADDRMDAVMLPVADGLTLARKK